MAVKISPVTSSCVHRYAEKQHVCFGISPFNSFFSEERIQALAAWGMENFERVSFFMPDGPSAFTLEALGYDVQKAEWKARRQGRYLKNKIVRALTNIGVHDSDADCMVLNWERLCENEIYVSLHQRAVDDYNENAEFQAACLEASRWVLERRVADTALLTKETLVSAVRYLLAEIPLFVDCAAIVGLGGSVFCYHQCPDFIVRLFEGAYPMQVSSKQGFIVIEMDGEPSSAHAEQLDAMAVKGEFERTG